MPPKLTTVQLAREFWSDPKLRLLAADEFQSRFEAIYESAQSSSVVDLPALWQLGGAANDYLRMNPRATLDCRDLALILLKANFVDARIIGLKLLSRTCKDWDEIMSWVSGALDSTSSEEITGGLYELGQHLERFESTGRMNEIDVPSLMPKLKVLRNSADECIRDNAKWCWALIFIADH